MKVVFLTGARNNCGDYLIVDRTRELFRKHLPGACQIVIDRTQKMCEEAFKIMQRSDLVVLVGGPLIRGNCAETLNLADAIESGRLDEIKTPFVIIGGGAKLKAPFSIGHLRFTDASRRLFEKLEASRYFSGTRDMETLVMLRNAGFTNFRYTGCPALYAGMECGNPIEFHRDSVRRIVFSCGAPGMMTEDSVMQHIDVAFMLRRFFSEAEIIVAAHHATDSAVYEAAYGKMPSGWRGLMDYFRSQEFDIFDVSGAVKPMKDLYSTADLHVGYRVHAHVLMTSWGKPSVLIAEDGRASGMADVISGRIFPAWKYRKRSARMSALRWCVGHRDKLCKVYDSKLAEKIERYLVASENIVLNTSKYGYDVMEKWFAQFRGGGG